MTQERTDEPRIVVRLDAAPDSPRRPDSLRDWQVMFAWLYGSQNRWLSPADIWLRVVEEAAQLSHVLRQQDHWQEALPGVFPDLFAWIFGFSNRLGFELEAAAWEKYPSVCPYCFRESEVRLYPALDGQEWPVQPCRCVAARKTEPYESFASLLDEQRLTNHRPTSLVEWQTMFDAIYADRHTELELRESLAFHFFEEVGEVAVDIRYEHFDGCRLEVADVFSWILCLANAAARREGGVQVPLQDVLWNAYPRQCKRCSAGPCTCPPRRPIP